MSRSRDAQLPNGWSSIPVEQFADLCLGKMLDRNKNRGTYRPYLRNLNVRWFDFDLVDILEMPFEESEIERYTARAGDLVVCEGGYPGRAAIWGGEAILLQKALHRVRCHDPERTKWLLYFLYFSNLTGSLEHYFSGAGIKHFTGESFKKMEVPLPPLAEQHRLVEWLDAAMSQSARARTAAKANLADIDSLETAAIVAHLGAPISVAEQDDAPDGWSWRYLIDVARLESGHTPSRRRPEWWGGEVPWIALPDIRELDGRVAFQTAETTNAEGLANSSARLLPTGTVVLSRTASVGFVTRMGRPMATSQDFVNWVCGPKLIPEYLTYALIASRPQLRALSEGAIHKTIYLPTVKAFRICLPPKPVQKRIVQVLNEVRANAASTRDACNAQLAAIDALPVALLSAAFRGDL